MDTKFKATLGELVIVFVVVPDGFEDEAELCGVVSVTAVVTRHWVEGA